MMAAGTLAAAVVAAAAATTPGTDAGPPRAERFATPEAAVLAALDETRFTGGVVAFGELHQTLATARVPSALKRFTAPGRRVESAPADTTAEQPVRETVAA